MEQEWGNRTENFWRWKMVRAGLLLHYYGIGLVILTAMGLFLLEVRGVLSMCNVTQGIGVFFKLLFLAGSCCYCFCPRKLVRGGNVLAFLAIFLTEGLALVFRFPKICWETFLQNPETEMLVVEGCTFLGWGFLIWFYGKLAYAVETQKPIQSFWMFLIFLFLAGSTFFSVFLLSPQQGGWDLILFLIGAGCLLFSFLAYIGMLKYTADALGQKIREQEEKRGLE